MEGFCCKGGKKWAAGAEGWRKKVSLLDQNVLNRQEAGRPWPWMVALEGDGPSTEAAGQCKGGRLVPHSCFLGDTEVRLSARGMMVMAVDG